MKSTLDHSIMLHVDHHSLMISQLLILCINEVITNNIFHSLVSTYNVARMYRLDKKNNSNNDEYELKMIFVW